MGKRGRKRASAELSIFPINQLPREILSKIFWYCVPDNTDSPIVISRNHAPILLCRICSSWRELALATPNLWTIVGIIVRNPDADPSVFSHVLNIWLERSGTLPLTLYLVQLRLGYDDPQRPTRPTLLKAILSVLYAHSSRWEDVTLNLYESPKLSLPRLGKLPLLRALHLHGPTQTPIRPPFGETPPRLTQLSWPYELNASKNPKIPWSQISYLDISTEMACFSALEMVRQCPQLEELSVSLNPDDPDHIIPRGPRVENYHLQKLSIGIYEDCSSFLDSLKLPALTELMSSLISSFFDDLEEDPGAVPFTDRSLLDFLTCSKCKLKKLKLSDCMFTDSVFLDCLAHESLETIEALNIEYRPKITDHVLSRLTDLPSPPAPRVLLPKLTHLTLEMCLAASPGMLGDMVYSRYFSQERAEQLEFLSLKVRDELSEEDKDIIEGAIEEGLDTSIVIER